jgi:hypothetical protein
MNRSIRNSSYCNLSTTAGTRAALQRGTARAFSRYLHLEGSLANSALFHDPCSMANCSEWEDLNAKCRIATLRYGRFVDSLKGLAETAADNEERKRLEDEMNEAARALARHQDAHGCRG